MSHSRLVVGYNMLSLLGNISVIISVAVCIYCVMLWRTTTRKRFPLASAVPSLFDTNCCEATACGLSCVCVCVFSQQTHFL